MKKALIIMIGFMMFCAMGFAQNAEKLVSYNVLSPTTSTISWLNTQTIDLGKIVKGTPKTVTFEFVNTGNDPIVISSAKGQCGCTNVEYSKEPVLFNKKGFVKVTYNASNVGVFNKSITVVTNTSEQTILLNIKGEVY